MNTCEICGSKEAFFWARIWGMLLKSCIRCVEHQHKLIITEKGHFASEINPNTEWREK